MYTKKMCQPLLYAKNQLAVLETYMGLFTQTLSDGTVVPLPPYPDEVGASIRIYRDHPVLELDIAPGYTPEDPGVAAMLQCVAFSCKADWKRHTASVSVYQDEGIWEIEVEAFDESDKPFFAWSFIGGGWGGTKYDLLDQLSRTDGLEALRFS